MSAAVENHQSFLIYRSSNGDEWHMVRHIWSDNVYVLHRANMASGGTETPIEVGPFLALGNGPEQQRLRQLMEAARAD